MTFPHYRQLDAMDCGATCLRIISKYHGKSITGENLRKLTTTTREGTSLLGLNNAAEELGYRTLAAKLNWHQLINDSPLPLIAHWQQKHFVVLYKIKKNHVYISDPAKGLIKITKKEFIANWASNQDFGEPLGVVLILEPTPKFYKFENEVDSKSHFNFIYGYIKPYKKYFLQLVIGLVIASIIQLIFPFLTQSIVDIGIRTQNLNFITLILIAQLMLFIGRTSVEFIRSWILLHLGTRINITLISDFLAKLMKLPISFFDSKITGDILQRIGDHSRIESFLTSSSLNTIFSLFNIIIFGIVLAIYDMLIFSIFFIGSALYVIWIILFIQKRRTIDNQRFDQMSNNHNSLLQLILGMQEIKLNNSELKKRWEWEGVQAKLFRVSIRSLKLEQYQEAGSLFINELKNILITFVAANAVIKGDITLGMMLAIQYIIGQLNSPIVQLVNFLHIGQDATISIERLNEIHNKKNEQEDEGMLHSYAKVNGDIVIENVSFKYHPHGDYALKNINLKIKENSTVAIVGASGSGKTTLIKLLLRFYEPEVGKIVYGGTDLKNTNIKTWRQYCGSVLQDGFIFPDTIANNISISDNFTNQDKLIYAVELANIKEYIHSLPMGFNTVIGSDGHGLSQGQKQRILIARAAYKDPKILFFDEATNSLDANNEKIIMNNINKFIANKTVVVVAHRLSTVKNSDQIIVLEKGEIIEKGNHQELTALKGAYYNLVKNQLELGV